MSKEMQKCIQEFKEDLRNEFKNLRESLERSIRLEERNLRADIEEMKSSMSFISNGLDEANKRLEASLTENKQLKKENEALRLQVVAIERDLATCQADLVKSEQYSRNRNLEIKNVKERPDESLSDILSKIGKEIDEPISVTDVDACHRVSTKDKNKRNIVVQFVRRDKRDKVLEKARKKRLTNEKLGLPTESSSGSSTDQPIYINEHLCQYMKRLLGMAVTRKREVGWKFVWVKNGNIFARRDEKSQVATIKRESDLDKICADG